MPDEDVYLIEALHQFYEGLGVDTYSSFKRENYGQIGITGEDATFLDKLAIYTSHVLTVLPGASKSPGTWEEIRYGGAFGKNFLFLFDAKDPEEEFQETLRTIIANISTRPFLVFIKFKSLFDLFKQAKEVWRYPLRSNTSDEDWNRLMESLESGLLKERLSGV